MSMARNQLLDQALALSQRMHDLGVEEQWDSVVELEPQRRALLEQAFATRVPVNQDAAEKVRQIIELDKVLVTRSLQARDQMGEQLGVLNKSRKASRAYQSV